MLLSRCRSCSDPISLIWRVSVGRVAAARNSASSRHWLCCGRLPYTHLRNCLVAFLYQIGFPLAPVSRNHLCALLSDWLVPFIHTFLLVPCRVAPRNLVGKFWRETCWFRCSVLSSRANRFSHVPTHVVAPRVYLSVYRGVLTNQITLSCRFLVWQSLQSLSQTSVSAWQAPPEQRLMLPNARLILHPLVRSVDLTSIPECLWQVTLRFLRIGSGQRSMFDVSILALLLCCLCDPNLWLQIQYTPGNLVQGNDARG